MKRIAVSALILTLAGCDLLPPTDLDGNSAEVASVTPADNATNVVVGATVIAQLELPNGGIDITTVSEQSVRLVDDATGQAVDANVSVNNDTETLTLIPAELLEFGTTYRFEVTSALTDEEGEAFAEHSSIFTTVSSDMPSVLKSNPADGEVDVSINISISTGVANTNGGVNKTSLQDPDAVYLVEASGGARVPGNVGSSGAGDSITFVPSQPLETNTRYQFNVTSALTDFSGTPFVPYTATFTTGSGADEPLPTDITAVPQPTAARQRYASLAVDPSGTYLYGLSVIGEIVRFPIGADGTLGAPESLNRLAEADGSIRLAIGLTFDPASTPGNPIVWVTHTALNGISGDVQNDVTEYWSGKLTRLSGPNLETIQDVVVGLPRSSKDHVTNSVAFNPAEPGVVYFVQGSNTAMGAPDTAWRYQPERVLSGAVLRLDTNLLGTLPLDVKTEDGGTYDPYATGAPLTLYATGTRNSYDLVWHSNGNLYVPANGSREGGNTPRYAPLPGTCENRPEGDYSGPILDNPSDVPQYRASEVDSDTGQTYPVDGWRVSQLLDDYLFKIEPGGGGYYGTPNPARCEWILNGGAVGFPGQPSTVIEAYPEGTGYDPNYRGPAGTFGQSISPNGAVEYKGSAFPGLVGKLLVTRYSTGDDVVAVTLGSDGNMVGAPTPIIARQPGGLVDPLDITESPTTGYLYVSWYDAEGEQEAQNAGITLLRP